MTKKRGARGDSVLEGRGGEGDLEEKDFDM